MRAGDTPSGSSEERVWIVPDSLRSTLARRYGPVLSGTEADRRFQSLQVFATCGDRVTAQALSLGVVPLVALVDYKTQRNEPISTDQFQRLADRHLIRVKNPAGMLTERLRETVRQLISAGGGLIEVDGEEDLGSLALVESMPAGATVIYGIPGEGASFVTVDAAAKERVRSLIAQMELRSIPLGD
jgi:GTP-dependent dephospho-CoA kinase